MAENDNLMVVEVPQPDKTLFAESKTLLRLAQDWDITTPDMATAAGEDLREIKRLAKEIEAKRTAITGPLNKALKEVNALFKPPKLWLQEGEALIKTGLLSYQRREERIAAAAQAKADAEAEKERKALERKAKVADVIGIGDKADELREEATRTVAPVIQSEAPKIAGVSVRKVWKAKIMDKKSFLRFVLDEREDLLALVQLDQSGLNALARLHKIDLGFPGIVAVEEESVTARG